MFSTNEDNFTFFFQIWMCFISFSCPITLTRTSSTILNRNGEDSYPFLVSTLRGKAFSLLPVSMMLAIDFYVDALYQVEELPFCF